MKKEHQRRLNNVALLPQVGRRGMSRERERGDVTHRDRQMENIPLTGW